MKVKSFQVGELETNCYIFRDERTGRCAIIDPGDMSAALRNAIEEAGCGNFDYILLTHCHFDHVDAAGEVKALTNAPIAIYHDDAIGLREPYINLSGAFGGDKMIYPSADVEFSDGEHFRVGETDFTVLHTPGHTAGSCCFVTEGIIFSGDTLFRQSVGRTDFPGGNVFEMQRSLKRLTELEGDYQVYPGHEGPTTLSHERLYNPYVQMLNEYD